MCHQTGCERYCEAISISAGIEHMAAFGEGSGHPHDIPQELARTDRRAGAVGNYRVRGAM